MTLFGLRPFIGFSKKALISTVRFGIKKDMLANYLRSENKNVEQLIEYGEQLGNGAVFKRLGFLLEKKAPDEAQTIEKCYERLTAGNTKLDPKLNNTKLITRWRLRVGY